MCLKRLLRQLQRHQLLQDLGHHSQKLQKILLLLFLAGLDHPHLQLDPGHQLRDHKAVLRHQDQLLQAHQVGQDLQPQETHLSHLPTKDQPHQLPKGSLPKVFLLQEDLHLAKNQLKRMKRKRPSKNQ